MTSLIVCFLSDNNLGQKLSQCMLDNISYLVPSAEVLHQTQTVRDNGSWHEQ